MSWFKLVSGSYGKSKQCQHEHSTNLCVCWKWERNILSLVLCVCVFENKWLEKWAPELLFFLQTVFNICFVLRITLRHCSSLLPLSTELFNHLGEWVTECWSLAIQKIILLFSLFPLSNIWPNKPINLCWGPNRIHCFEFFLLRVLKQFSLISGNLLMWFSVI